MGAGGQARTFNFLDIFFYETILSVNISAEKQKFMYGSKLFRGFCPSVSSHQKVIQILELQVKRCLESV